MEFSRVFDMVHRVACSGRLCRMGSKEASRLDRELASCKVIGGRMMFFNPEACSGVPHGSEQYK